MHKITIICFIIWLIFTGNTKIAAQENHYVGTNMLSFFNFKHAYLPINYNRKLNENIRLNAEVGMIVQNGIWNQGRTELTKQIKKNNERGIRLSFEPQYIIKPQKTRADYEKSYENTYFSLELNAMSYKYESVRGFTENLDTLKRFNISNRTLGLNALFGQMRMIKKNRLSLMWVFNVGGGVRFVNIKNNLDIPFNLLSDRYRASIYSEPEEKGNYIRFNIMLNAKVFIGVGKR